MQFLIDENNTLYSVPEQCQMALEGGCGWIELRASTMAQGELRDVGVILANLCKESQAILTITDNIELAKDLGVHGICLSLDSGYNAGEVRESLGPEAIIGVEVDNIEAIKSLKGKDIDYIVLPEYVEEHDKSQFVARVREIGIDIPIVFCGNYGLDNVLSALSQGASGVLTGSRIMDAADPVEYMREMLNRIQNSH